jgi:hypothetical protein
MTGFGRIGSIPLLAALVALCGVIALETVIWRQAAPLYASPGAATIAGDSAPNDTSGVPRRRNAWLREILARPLFDPNRYAAEAGTRGLPRLAGIVLAGPQRVAIFAAAAGEHPIVVAAGGHVGAYEVLAVTDAGVTIAGPEGTTLIKPVFDAGRPSASSAESPLRSGMPAK